MPLNIIFSIHPCLALHNPMYECRVWCVYQLWFLAIINLLFFQIDLMGFCSFYWNGIDRRCYHLKTKHTKHFSKLTYRFARVTGTITLHFSKSQAFQIRIKLNSNGKSSLSVFSHKTSGFNMPYVYIPVNRIPKSWARERILKFLINRFSC